MKKLFFALLTVSAVSAGAQKFEVTAVRQVNAPCEVYHPVFTPDGRSLLVAISPAYDGLGVINLSNDAYTRLSDSPSAAYKAVVTDDSRAVICRELNFEDMTLSLKTVDLTSGDTKVLARGLDHFNTIALSGENVKVMAEGQNVELNAGRKVASRVQETMFVTEEDLKVVLYRGDTRTVVDPLSTPERDVNYCWSSLSPDKRHLLFVAGNDAYVSDLEGINLVCLGRLHAPVWRGNDYVVAMDDKDDGSRFTASEIVIVGVDGNNRQQLSSTSDEIKMFPAVSNDGAQVAYHSTDGKVYVMTIKEK